MDHPQTSTARPLRHPLTTAAALSLTLALAPVATGQQVHEFQRSTVAHPAAVLALGDVDGDGLPDLASSGSALGITQVLLGQGDGTFSAVSSLPLNAQALAFGDVDAGNGDLDLVTGGFDGQLTVHLGDGAGGFTTAGSVHVLGTSGNTQLRDLELADLDGDGLTDVAAASALPNTASFLLGDGAGGLSIGSVVPVDGLFLRGIELGDVDLDGDLDALVGAGGTELTLLRNHGAGSFAVTAQLGSLIGLPGVDLFGVDLAVSDLNADGRVDVVFSQTGPHDVGVLLGNGPLSFAAPVYHGAGDSPERLAIADIDGDGAPDVLAANSHAERLLVLRGDGSGGLTTVSTWPLSGVAARPAVADLDADGDPDAVALDLAGGQLDVLLNQGPGAFENLGGGIPQAQDLPAVLTGSGTMVAGASNLLDLAFAEGTTSILVVGASALSAPFKFGVLVPQPDLLLGGLTIGRDDEVLIPFVVPPTSPPGTDVWVQHWFASPAGPAGWIASNGLRATVQ